ncbi:hypothetical protein JZU51_00340, partial [bacterium]|nr:hypothetical protein [bacterium]
MSMVTRNVKDLEVVVRRSLNRGSEVAMSEQFDCLRINTSWGMRDGKGDDNQDDRIVLIENTPEARTVFGENFGAFEFRLTAEQVEGMLSGKAVAV